MLRISRIPIPRPFAKYEDARATVDRRARPSAIDARDDDDDARDASEYISSARSRPRARVGAVARARRSRHARARRHHPRARFQTVGEASPRARARTPFEKAREKVRFFSASALVDAIAAIARAGFFPGGHFPGRA